MTYIAMNRIWRVDRNTGARAYIVHLDMRKEIWRPQSMSRHDFFRLLAPGVQMDEDSLRRVFSVAW
jgi:hypothetical protein